MRAGKEGHMAFPPNYRQGRQDRTRAKDQKRREKEARREERRQQKSTETPDDTRAGEQQAAMDKE
jgi:hypothetical protein